MQTTKELKTRAWPWRQGADYQKSRPPNDLSAAASRCGAHGTACAVGYSTRLAFSSVSESVTTNAEGMLIVRMLDMPLTHNALVMRRHRVSCIYEYK